MDSAEDKPKAFKVDDKRRFSSEGELKPEHRSEEQPATTSASQARPAEQKPQPGPPHGETIPPELTFAGFIVSLSTQALLSLGEIADPSSSQPHRDLAGAQQVIDILGMLREKTRGNLDPDEEGLLDSILFDLRMKYVEIARQSAR
jgi:hypothetical protein